MWQELAHPSHVKEGSRRTRQACGARQLSRGGRRQVLWCPLRAHNDHLAPALIGPLGGWWLPSRPGIGRPLCGSFRVLPGPLAGSLRRGASAAEDRFNYSRSSKEERRLQRWQKKTRLTCAAVFAPRKTTSALPVLRRRLTRTGSRPPPLHPPEAAGRTPTLARIPATQEGWWSRGGSPT